MRTSGATVLAKNARTSSGDLPPRSSNARSTNTWKSDAVAPNPSESGCVARKRAVTDVFVVRTQLVSASAMRAVLSGGGSSAYS